MSILNFTDFLNERFEKNNNPSLKMAAAGIAIIYNNKILLVHPTNGSWQKGTCGIPKGKMESHEDYMDAAIRETYEETGILLDSTQLDPSPDAVNFYNKHGEVERQLIYFVCRISDLSEIGLSNLTIPKSNLQIDEIDWAKFVSAEDAHKIISNSQRIILDRLLTLS